MCQCLLCDSLPQENGGLKLSLQTVQQQLLELEENRRVDEVGPHSTSCQLDIFTYSHSHSPVNMHCIHTHPHIFTNARAHTHTHTHIHTHTHTGDDTAADSPGGEAENGVENGVEDGEDCRVSQGED